MTGCPTRAMPPSLAARKQAYLPGKSGACVPPLTGLLAATNVWSALHRRVNRCSGTGMKVAW